jgi:hypothetical protein
MHFAEQTELKPIYSLFASRRDVFPHIRLDALSRRIEAKQCIFEEGVAITYQQYRKLTHVGSLAIPSKSVMLHQIINGRQFSGAAGRIFDRFFNEIAAPLGGDLYLTVREENTVACLFYERHGMASVGNVSWAGGAIPGLIYRKSSTQGITHGRD